jgi:hypothetical protein
VFALVFSDILSMVLPTELSFTDLMGLRMLTECLKSSQVSKRIGVAGSKNRLSI